MELLTWLVAADRPRGLDPNIVRPGYVALAIVLAMCVAVFFLARSFSKHTKRAAQPWEGDDADASITREDRAGEEPARENSAREESDAGR